MAYIDFISAVHKSTKRDYLGRVNEYPKEQAAVKAKKWGYDYWDGDRRICYGGLQYYGRGGKGEWKGGRLGKGGIFGVVSHNLKKKDW